MAWSATDIPDLSGRIAVVTGANGGLGLEVSRELARSGAHVVMASRDQDEAELAREGHRGRDPGRLARTPAARPGLPRVDP